MRVCLPTKALHRRHVCAHVCAECQRYTKHGWVLLYQREGQTNIKGSLCLLSPHHSSCADRLVKVPEKFEKKTVFLSSLCLCCLSLCLCRQRKSACGSMPVVGAVQSICAAMQETGGTKPTSRTRPSRDPIVPRRCVQVQPRVEKKKCEISRFNLLHAHDKQPRCSERSCRQGIIPQQG